MPRAGDDAAQPRRRLGFLAASMSLTVVFAVSASPIPLYNTYRAGDGLSNADVALTVVAYFAGTIAALLTLGRLPNHLGRRPTSLATLALLAAGCAALLDVHTLAPLVLGRVLMGVGCGLASSALTAYVVDTAPRRPVWLAAVVTSQAPVLGLTIGALGSGALAQYGPAPRTLAYLLGILALAVCAVLVAASPETAAPHPGAWRSLRPRVHLPAPARRPMPVAAAVVVSTWAMGAFYQGFVPGIVADQLGTRNAVVFGAVFSAFMAAGVVAAPLFGRWGPTVGQRVGMVVFLGGVLLILASMLTGAVGLFVVASVVAGVGQGVAFSASLRTLLHGISPVQRAPVLAATYLICYGSAALASLVSGQLSHTVGLVQIVLGYAALAVAGTAYTLARAGRS